MGRAEDIFERIKKDGIAAIDEFISTRKSEELFLDFKRSSNNGAGKFLDQKDRNNLAEAISGFGNSEGGVIIWGIDCSKDTNYADVAHTKCQIEDIKRFVSGLENAVSGCTVPPHSGVQHYPIVINDKEDGFAVTYIPKSDHAPHQVVGKLHYYIRAGSNFMPTPHGVLAGMFGRKPQPHVSRCITSYPPKVINKKIEIQINFMIKNEGPVIASDLFMNAIVGSIPGRNCKFKFEPPDSSYWIGQVELAGIQVSAISRFELRLPPGSFIKLFDMYVSISPPFSNHLLIDGVYGCGQSPSSEFKIENGSKTIQKLYNDFLEKHRKALLTYKDSQKFMDNLLNTKNKKCTMKF